MELAIKIAALVVASLLIGLVFGLAFRKFPLCDFWSMFLVTFAGVMTAGLKIILTN